MRTALAIGLCLLGVLSAAAADSASAEDRPSAQTIRDSYRAQLNDNTVTIMAGSADGTDLAIVQDLAAVLDDGEHLRVVPMVGKGPSQNLKDVLFMRGVDMGITQANVLKHYAKTGRTRAQSRKPGRLHRQAIQRRNARAGAHRGERHSRAGREDRQRGARGQRRGDHRARRL